MLGQVKSARDLPEPPEALVRRLHKQAVRNMSRDRARVASVHVPRRGGYETVPKTQRLTRIKIGECASCGQAVALDGRCGCS